MTIEQIETHYRQLGGTFYTNALGMREKLRNIRAFVYDWDGVFNNGEKGATHGSSYKEADSMGTNLLRFSYWLQHGRLPYVGILSGADNPTAVQLSEREHFDFAYIGAKDKGKALDKLNQKLGLKDHEVAFFFDDTLDLPIAQRAGLRYLVRRDASPLFTNLVCERGWVDYHTANSGEQFAVRETAELLMALHGNYHEVVDARMRFEGPYEQYLQERNERKTIFY